jgi:hypothetical protein
MSVTFRGTKNVSALDLSRLNSLAQFVLEKFFTNAKLQKLEVEVRFKKNLFEKTRQYANCIWEDQHYRPEEFSIDIEPDQSLPMLLNSLAHELVHVKQWAKGEFYELQRERKVYKFNGQRFDTSKLDYWDTPWEIEAHGRAIGLVVQWARANGLEDEELVVEG